ncbi:MAG: hypothetical protein IKY94_12375 [Lachnospiraceae bacterium]|nr:hypothetical protein [Lachnospiraceae bacterium]
MNHILAVCDSETEYAYQLVDYFSNKKGFPFQVQMFSSENNLKEYAKNHPILVALIAQKDFSEDIKTVPVEHILILGEDCEKEIKDIKIIEKYQSCERIIKELLDWLFQEGVLGRSISNSKEMKLIGIYSPVGKCLKTSFSFVLGQLLGKKHKVLYLNMESYSGLGQLLQKEFSTDMSELIYYLQNSKEKFIYRMGSMAEKAGGLDILPPFDSFLDFVSVSGDEWIQLFQEIEKGSDYEYLILDLSDAVQGLFDILRLCDVVYTLSREDGFSMAKIAQYEEVLKKCNYEDVWKKTRHCTIPLIKNLPPGLLQLTFTELAEYVRERIEEDLE